MMDLQGVATERPPAQAGCRCGQFDPQWIGDTIRRFFSPAMRKLLPGTAISL
jgi:hypothetical protein